jgi:hypothetical protein
LLRFFFTVTLGRADAARHLTFVHGPRKLPEARRNQADASIRMGLADTAAKITGALGADAFDGDAHGLLMAIYKDAAQPIELRMDAAKAAIGYEMPRLAAVEGKVEGRMTLEQLVLESMRREEGI